MSESKKPEKEPVPRMYSGEPESLKSERRKKLIPVDLFEKEVVKKLRFKNVAVDYGAGIGYFTVPLAKHFRKVYAVEVNKKMVESLEKELKTAGIENVEILLSDSPPHLNEDIDFVLFSNVLHEVDDYKKFLDWGRRARVVCVIDWMKEEMEFGPPVEHRIDKEEMKSAMKERFRYVIEVPIYSYHYLFVGYHDESVFICE